VIAACEALAHIAPPAPVRSLRQHTRAQRLRNARLCYDHLAGQLGVALMRALIDRGALTGGDGMHRPADAPRDRLSAPGHDVDYKLTGHGVDQLIELGIDLNALGARRRPLIRYCLDWTEQRHHLAGSLGAAIADRLFELDWIRRTLQPRAVELTDHGRDHLTKTLGLDLERVSTTSQMVDDTVAA
jgi:hypothetical protein